MTGITHKQAHDYINATADHLIQEPERELLNEHLKICEECRVYAEQTNTLESRLQQSFHHRWDHLLGPSEKLAQNVQSRTRSTPRTGQIKLRPIIVATLLVLVLLFGSGIWLLKSLSTNNHVTALSGTVAPSSERLIAFVSAQAGNSEIYVMRTDGSGVADITKNPAFDGNPAWSPDGTRIAFESDRDGNRDIFVMNPDGSGLTQLTYNPASDILGASPTPPNFGVGIPDVWSPDSRHILFSDDHTGQWMLNVMNVDGSGVTQLMQANDPPALEALWSPSGKQVAYNSNPENGWMQIVAVNMDGTDRRVISTGNPTKGNPVWISGGLIAWSQDERYIYYEYDTGDGYWYIAKAAADGTNTSQIVASGSALVQGIYRNGWLEDDSALYYVTEPQGISDNVTLQQANTGKTLHWNPLAICDISPNTNIGSPFESWAGSHGGSQLILVVSCSNKGYSEIYNLDIQTEAFKKIAQIPRIWIDSDIIWSADDQMVLIQGEDQFRKTEIYLLSRADLQAQSPGTPKLVWSGESSQAILQPDQFSIIAIENRSSVVFPLNLNTNFAQLWTDPSKRDLIEFDFNRDGYEDNSLAGSNRTGDTNLTNNPKDSGGPVWSPDANNIAFMCYRNDSVPVIELIRSDGII